jgi:hypothetical protein
VSDGGWIYGGRAWLVMVLPLRTSGSLDNDADQASRHTAQYDTAQSAEEGLCGINQPDGRSSSTEGTAGAHRGTRLRMCE